LKIEGNFDNDTLNGSGIEIMYGVYKYEGEFKNMMIDGRGKMIWDDGQ
jgi:hypothetical protein